VARARRWLIASLAAVAAFLLVWWGLAGGWHWSRGDAIGLAAVAFAVVIAPLGWWAALPVEADGEGDESPDHSVLGSAASGPWRPLTVLKQKARARGHARIIQAGGDVVVPPRGDRRSADDREADG
jgi:hypothetical protein